MVVRIHEGSRADEPGPLLMGQRRRGRAGYLRRRDLAGWLFVAPVLIFSVIFFLGPLLFAIVLSLHQWDMISPVTQMTWVGFLHYVRLLQDPLFRLILRNTFAYTLGSLVFIPPLSLGIAFLLNARVRLQWLWRTLYFTPVVTSTVALSIVWTHLFDQNFGPINALLGDLHLPLQPWLSSPTEAMLVVISLSVWQSLGYYAIIFLAGLQGIPQELYEAGSLDGAGQWAQFRSITLPLLRTTTLFVIVIITINALQVFVPIFVITNGGPVDTTDVVVLKMYDVAFNYLQMGTASAMAMILFLIVLICTLIQFRLARTDN
ncbi:MAG TPA: sugar ABC transporter permease [Chloroflexota bacterium]|nr:sugar ABC transporter permease [Chloroflexota bacterium]